MAFVLFLCQTHSWCKNGNNPQFLKDIYTLERQYSVWGDGFQSVQNMNRAPDSIDAYYFFSHTNIVQRGDTVMFTANLGSIFRVLNPISGREEMMFNVCLPFVEFSKVDKDSCWRGVYASEMTGTCNAILTIENNEMRIAGIGNDRAFVFFSQFKIDQPKNEVEVMIRKHLGE